MLACFKFLALLCLFVDGVSCIQWSQDVPNGSLKYACAGDSVSMPWDYTLSLGENLEDVQWFYQGRSNEMIAVLTRGVFLPLPAFSHRVTFLGKAGITLLHVTTADSGNYSVEVSGRGSTGDFFKFRRTVFLQIGSDLMTSDGELHVHENPKAVLDRTINKWSVELQCGTFTYLGQPPFSVEWISPSKTVLNNSIFENGQFKLYLSTPIEGGNYTCRIPTLSTHTACLLEGGPHKGEATYVLDPMVARLTLLEAHQNALQKENDVLRVENSALKISDFDQTTRLLSLEAKISQHVSFHAHNLRNTQPRPGAPLIADTVLINQGFGYNSTTGKFTAPLNGTYFFIGTSGSWAAGKSGQFSLTVDGVDVSFVSTRDQGPVQAASVHGVVRLSEGQKVWLKVSSGIEFSSAATSFSGFLISPDP